MSEPETIEAEVAEVVGQALEIAAPAPVNLFRSEEPAEIIRRATDVADALKAVLVEKKLTKRIGKNEHVLVEGWTLCGSMLGVFPVCVWTRKLDDGWEARVEARTLAGAVVGAAEAECLRSEKEWGPNPSGGKPRDDYALRSMAQTRATSKALRQPLGFIVTLAGFTATPAEEVGAEPEYERRIERPKPETPRSWAALERGIFGDNQEEAIALFQAFVRAATFHLYGETSLRNVTADQRQVVWQKGLGAYYWLHDNVEPDGAFTYIREEHIRSAFAAVMDGARLEIPDYEPPKTDPEADAIADEVFQGE